MSYTYKYLSTPTDEKQAVEMMQTTIMPMLQKYWDSVGNKKFEKPIDFKILTFVHLWLVGGLYLAIAEDASKQPCGILLGVRFVPMMYEAKVLQVEALYGEDKEVEEGLVKYTMTVLPFMELNEIWLNVPQDVDKVVTWPEKQSFNIRRFVKDK